MKSLNTYINEWKYSKSSNVESQTVFKEVPKTRDDLNRIIIKRLHDNGERPFLLDIDTSNIDDFSNLFSAYHYLRSNGIHSSVIRYIDISTWNTSNVKNMSNMFEGCARLKDIKLSFDTSNVENMSGMFYGCKSLEYLNLPFNTSKLKNVNHMFSGCFNLKEIYHIDEWDVSNLDAVDGLDEWNTKIINNVTFMFNLCANLKKPNWKSK